MVEASNLRRDLRSKYGFLFKVFKEQGYVWQEVIGGSGPGIRASASSCPAPWRPGIPGGGTTTA
eukprot:6264099-Alexandrium_andersonii.AAC.1